MYNFIIKSQITTIYHFFVAIEVGYLKVFGGL